MGGDCGEERSRLPLPLELAILLPGGLVGGEVERPDLREQGAARGAEVELPRRPERRRARDGDAGAVRRPVGLVSDVAAGAEQVGDLVVAGGDDGLLEGRDVRAQPLEPGDEELAPAPPVPVPAPEVERQDPEPGPAQPSSSSSRANSSGVTRSRKRLNSATISSSLTSSPSANSIADSSITSSAA